MCRFLDSVKKFVIKRRNERRKRFLDEMKKAMKKESFRNGIKNYRFGRNMGLKKVRNG